MRTEDNAEQYYEDLTAYINEYSGLDEVSSEQVKWVCRLDKKFVGTHGDSEPSRTPRQYIPKNPCTARRSDGQPCRKAAINGSNVCRTHGGAAKQTINAARIRLQNATLLMAQQLLRMATDENVNDAVKLKAITEALDRGGVMTKSSVDLGFMVKPHEAIFEQMSGGSRSAHRGEVDLDDTPPALVAPDSHDLAPIDAQIVEDDLDGDNPVNLSFSGQAIRPDGDEDRSPFDSEPPAVAVAMPMDQANAELARLRAAHSGGARINRVQRALPRGRG